MKGDIVMKQHRKQKQAITLLEIMIVIFLIGLIGSVIGYNVKGSLEEGKAFRTDQGINQIRDILMMQAAEGVSLEDLVSAPKAYLEASGLVKDVDKLQKDGWGIEYRIQKNNDGTDFEVISDKFNAYKEKKQKALDAAKSKK